MNCKLPVLLLLAVLPVCAQAQNVPRPFRGGGNTLSGQLLEEIYLLQRIVPLALTDVQLEAVLGLYDKYPSAAEPEQDQVVAKLQEIKRRLLGGTPLVATDLATLRDLMRQAYRGRRGEDNTPPPPGGAPGAAPAPPATGPFALSSLEQALWDQFTPQQRAVLLGDVRGPAANNQKADVALSKRAMVQVAELRQLDDPRWPAERDRLATALAAGAGEAGSAQVDNSRKLFVDFLERVRRMSGADFANRQDELAAELLALLPPHTNLIVALAEYDKKLVHDAMSASLAHPRAAELLRQMKAARAPTQAP